MIPTPSVTSSNTPTITPSPTNCPGLCFSGTGFDVDGIVDTSVQDIFDPYKIVLTGQFLTFNGVNRRSITRIFTDGEIDYTFDSGLGFTPGIGRGFDLAQQTDGKYIVVGQFNTYQGVSRRNIARINYDGSLDTTFQVGTGFTGLPLSVELLPDGKIIVAGEITQYSGTNVSRICRLNTNGSLDTTFNSSTFTANTRIEKTLRNPDGTFYVVGNFVLSGRRGIVLLNADGTYNPSLPFNASGNGLGAQTGLPTPMGDVEVLPNGQLIVVGDFSNYNGTNIGRGIVRLNPDGTRDTSFITTPFGYQNQQNEVIIQGSKYICVGSATAYQGIPINQISRLNPDGSLDLTWNSAPFNAAGAFAPLIHITQLTGNTNDSGYIFATGNFTSYDGISALDIVKMNQNGFIQDCDPVVPSATPTGTPTRTPTQTQTQTPSRTPTQTATNTNTPTPSQTIGLTPSNTPTLTPTPSITATNTQTPSQTATNTPTQTATPEITPSNTPTITPTATSGACECICWSLTFTAPLTPTDLQVRWRDCQTNSIITDDILNLEQRDNLDGTYTAYICVADSGTYNQPVCVLDSVEVTCDPYEWMSGSQCCTPFDCNVVPTPEPTPTQTATPSQTIGLTPSQTPTLTLTPSITPSNTPPPPPELCECWEIENTDSIDISIRYYNCQGAEECVVVDVTSSRQLCISANTDNLILVSSGTTCAGGAEPSYTWSPLGTNCTGDTECFGVSFNYIEATQYLDCIQNSAPGAFLMRVPTTYSGSWFCGDDGQQYQFHANQSSPFSYTITAVSEALTCNTLPC